jgi:hypothetical protein
MILRQCLLVVAMFLCACATPKTASTKTDETALRAQDFQPLQLGTSWEYALTLLGANQTVNIELVKIDGPYVVDSTGAHFSIDQFGLRDEKRYLLRNPIRIGTTWTNVVSVSSIERYEIVSAGESCAEGSKTFARCIVVRSRNTIREDQVLEAEMTFGEGVGIVKATTALLSKGQRIPQSTLTLVRFNPAVAPAASSR